MFGIFNKKGEKKLSFGMGGYSFVSDGTYLKYQSIYGKFFRVRIVDIETVSLDKSSMGKQKIIIAGKGTVLAELDLPKNWAEKVQEFIFEEIDKFSRS